MLASKENLSLINETPDNKKAEFSCFYASDIIQIEQAWKIVYEQYFKMGYIYENPFQIYTNPSILNKDICVLIGPNKSYINYTMTLTQDNLNELSLDKLYKDSLDKMRQQGYKILEVGLLANKEKRNQYNLKALLNMMKEAIYYAIYKKLTHIIIGVNPRHMTFYQTRYGFEPFGITKTYPAMNNNLVIPLQLCLKEQMIKDKPPKGILDIKNHPVKNIISHSHILKNNSQIENSIILKSLKTY